MQHVEFELFAGSNIQGWRCRNYGLGACIWAVLRTHSEWAWQRLWHEEKRHLALKVDKEDRETWSREYTHPGRPRVRGFWKAGAVRSIGLWYRKCCGGSITVQGVWTERRPGSWCELSALQMSDSRQCEKQQGPGHPVPWWWIPFLLMPCFTAWCHHITRHAISFSRLCMHSVVWPSHHQL